MLSVAQRAAVAAVVTAASFAALGSAAEAATMFSSRTAWDAAVLSSAPVNITDPEATFHTGPTPAFDGIVAFDSDTFVLQAGSGWPLGFTGAPMVLYFLGTTTVIGTFTATMPAFGFEMAPDTTSPFSMTLDIGGGNTLTQIVASVDTPSFFGWTEGTGTTMTLTCDGCNFAVANMVVGTPLETPPPPPPPTSVVEPTTIALFGLGLAGLGYTRRRKSA